MVGAVSRSCAEWWLALAQGARDGSYASANDPRVLVGLGDPAAPVSVRVRWPSGRTEMFAGVAVDRYVTLTEGSGQVTRYVAVLLVAVSDRVRRHGSHGTSHEQPSGAAAVSPCRTSRSASPEVQAQPARAPRR